MHFSQSSSLFVNCASEVYFGRKFEVTWTNVCMLVFCQIKYHFPMIYFLAFEMFYFLLQKNLCRRLIGPSEICRKIGKLSQVRATAKAHHCIYDECLREAKSTTSRIPYVPTESF